MRVLQTWLPKTGPRATICEVYESELDLGLICEDGILIVGNPGCLVVSFFVMHTQYFLSSQVCVYKFRMFVLIIIGLQNVSEPSSLSESHLHICEDCIFTYVKMGSIFTYVKMKSPSSLM